MISARQVVERAGLDVNLLIDQLSSAAAAELSAVYRYTLLTAYPLGFADEDLRQILKDIRDEDRHHFEALVGRIYELDGTLPDDIRQFLEIRHEPPQDSAVDAQDPVTALIEDVRRAVHPYNDLCGRTEGRDQRTFALAQAIRNEKVEHQAWLDEFLGTGPAGRFRRGFRGRSPFLTHRPQGSGSTAG